MNRTPTATEAMHNLLYRHNGTASPGILPARRAILSIIQSARPTTFRDDIRTWEHFRARRQ